MTGCAMSQKTVQLTSSFDEMAARNLLEQGTNTVEGSGLIRQQGGGIVTCAGNEVWLVPVTEYSTERMNVIYGSDQQGYSESGAPKFEPTPASFMELTRTTVGDAQGNFEFDEVADGDFYVVTSITWAVGYSRQGGTLMRRVSVADGGSKKVILSP
jgi:hypothetical protein